MSSDLKIFTENIEPEAVNQIYELIKTPAFDGSKVRIMPDVHSSKNCVVGFTTTTQDKIVPNVLGADIGCGMLTVLLGKQNIDFELLDDFIRKNIPAGAKVHKSFTETDLVKSLRCFNSLENLNKLYSSLCTLGGGNHFIEIDVDDGGECYLVIHSGSRNLGKQVAEIYQNKAIMLCKNIAELPKHKAAERLISEGDVSKIPETLKQISKQYSSITKTPPGLCFLWGAEMENYLHDVKICQEFAGKNRLSIADKILKHLRVNGAVRFDTVHNYIDENGIIRKGAIAAPNGKRVIIPMNMRDGCIIAEGKGNPDWNFSAPHGAGRLYSRQDVKANFTVDDFRQEMDGIYTTSVGAATLDEAPMAYKPMSEIISLISPTVSIEKIIKPIYNFKAGK